VRLDHGASIDDELRMLIRWLDLNNVHGLSELLKLHYAFLVRFDALLQGSEGVLVVQRLLNELSMVDRMHHSAGR
jgi:hypothetical protein